MELVTLVIDIGILVVGGFSSLKPAMAGVTVTVWLPVVITSAITPASVAGSTVCNLAASAVLAALLE